MRCGRHSGADHGKQSRAGSGRTAPAANAVVPEYVELGQGIAESRGAKGARHARSDVRGAGALAIWKAMAAVHRATGISVHGERDERVESVQSAQPHPVREGCVSRIHHSCKQSGGKSGDDWNEAGGALRIATQAGRIRDIENATDGYESIERDGFERGRVGREHTSRD